jgi:hypothetical protein
MWSKFWETNHKFISNYILGLVQNAIVKSTDEDVVVQRDGLYQRMVPIIEAAALAKVNVLCFQEAWSKKFKIKPWFFRNLCEKTFAGKFILKKNYLDQKTKKSCKKAFQSHRLRNKWQIRQIYENLMTAWQLPNEFLHSR